MTTTPATAAPTRKMFTNPKEVIIHVREGDHPDEHGRLRFVEYRLDGRRVHVQGFHSNLDALIDQHLAAGRTVRVIEVRHAGGTW